MADDEEPLKAEALARGKWRSDGATLKEADAPGHTLPESESDEAGGQETGSRSPLDTIRPPD
jgi:hypothetical protein